MITVAEAESIVAAHLVPFESELCSLFDAHGLVLREDILADRDYPPFDRVTMDGIALCSQRALGGQKRFVIEATQKAGEASRTLDGTENCIEVMTGAVMPPGTDCVVRVEDLDVVDGVAQLRDGAAVAAGQNIHRCGSDLLRGAPMLRSGTRLLAPQIAVAASVGKAQVRVSRRPSVAIVSTGDELVDVGDTPAPHQIRRSNVYALRASLLLRKVENVRIAHFVDDPAVLRAGIGEILEGVDVLLISGGVSMGKFDFVPGILHDLGVKKLFHKVSQRPGKPLWFGSGPKGQLVFALPGNPVSAVVCAHRYFFPQLDKAMGLVTNSEYAVLTEPVSFGAALTYFLPVRMRSNASGQLEATPAPTNGSGDLGGLVNSDGFVELALERDTFPAGYVAPVYRWNG